MEQSSGISKSKDISAKIINVDSSKLRGAVRAVSGIAKNASTEEDRLVNLMCYNNIMIVTATDSMREIEITIEVNSNIEEVFSTNVDKLMAVLTDTGTTRIEVHDEYLLLYKGNTKVQIPKYKVNHKPFKSDFVYDVINGRKFLKILNTFTKYMTTEMDSSGVLILSDNNVYVRTRLFYAITEFPIRGYYIFDKTTCKNIVTLINYGLAQGHRDMTLATVENGTAIIINIGSCSMRVPMLRSEKVDLSRFNSITNVNGFLVKRENITNAIKEIKTVEGTSELDIQGINKTLTIRPSKETSLTEYNIPASEIKIDENKPLNFTYTVNSTAFEMLLKGVNTDHTLLCSTGLNMLMLMNKDTDINIRYFLSVY